MSQVVFTTRHKWRTTSNMSHATQHLTRYKFMSQVTCHESTIACYMSPHITCHKIQVHVTSHVSSQKSMLWVNYCMLHATAHITYVTRYKFMSQVACQVKSPCHESIIACYTHHTSQDTSSHAMNHKLHVKSQIMSHATCHGPQFIDHKSNQESKSQQSITQGDQSQVM